MSRQQIFCMAGGAGETSYANNSIFQRTIIRKVKPLLEESIREVISCNTSPECLTIADLGCSSGPNALVVLQSIIDVVVATCQSSGLPIIPEFNVFLNDLPRNDFNTIFKTLPSFHREIEGKNGVGIRCYISGSPGSFYGRLFPRNLMHFMHSSTCLHWLSQVPKGVMEEDGKEALNKGSIYTTKESPREVLNAYRQQFGQDFATFLRCRSKETVQNGRIVLNFVVTQDDEACPLMELISIALYKLASQELINEEKLDGFNLPFYRPTIQQVKEVIECEGSLALHKLDTFPLSWVATMRDEQGENATQNDVTTIHESNMKVAESITQSIRAMTEPLLASEFGEEIMDDVFRLVEVMVIDNLETGQEVQILNLVVSLLRN